MYNSTFFLGEIAKSLNEISKKLDKNDNDTIVPENLCNNEYACAIVDLRTDVSKLNKEIKEITKKLNILETRINCLELHERIK
jgi:chaperonin cofactor prefoldin